VVGLGAFIIAQTGVVFAANQAATAGSVAEIRSVYDITLPEPSTGAMGVFDKFANEVVLVVLAGSEQLALWFFTSGVAASDAFIPAMNVFVHGSALVATCVASYVVIDEVVGGVGA
jgi:hypothetical protein